MIGGGDAVGRQLAVGVDQRGIDGKEHVRPRHELTLERVAMHVDQRGGKDQARRVDPFALHRAADFGDAAVCDGDGRFFLARRQKHLRACECLHDLRSLFRPVRGLHNPIHMTFA